MLEEWSPQQPSSIFAITYSGSRTVGPCFRLGWIDCGYIVQEVFCVLRRRRFAMLDAQEEA